MEKTYDYEHRFFGLWSAGGVCRVRIYEGGDSEKPVVMVSESPYNHNTSVTNMTEAIAAEVCLEHSWLLKTGFEPPFALIEHYPRTEQDLRRGIEETFAFVQYASYEPSWTYSFAMKRQRPRLGRPSWVHVPREIVEAMVGERQ